MPSSPTTRNRLEKQGAGENSNTWGAPKLNTVIDLLDASLDGLTTKALTGNYSLTSTNYAADESRNRVLRFTGTGTFTVTIPGVEKWYIVDNQTTGNLTITTGSGTTAVIPTGVMSAVTCDGVNCKPINPVAINPTFSGVATFNGSTASGQVNIRAATGSDAIVLDNPSNNETLSFTSRRVAGFATGYAANATLSLGTTTANTLQFVTGNTSRYTISDVGIHQLNGAGNTGVFNVRATSGSAANVLDNTAGSERIHMVPRSSAGIAKVVSQSADFWVGCDGSNNLQFVTGGVNRGGISGDGLTVYFTGIANYVAGAAANVYVDPGTGRLSQVTSSRIFKKDIAPYVPGGNIDDLAPVFYRVINEGDGPTYAGLIAEEVHAAGFPEFVAYNGEGQPHSVHYPNMVALLIHEVQGLRRRVSDLEAR